MPLRNLSPDAWSTKISAVPIQQKQSASTGAAVSLVGQNQAVWHHANINAFAREGYTQNPDVYACINWIATAIKGIQFNAYIVKGDEWKKLEDGSLPCQIARRPNPEQSWAAFIEELVINVLTSGNAYIERVGPSPTKPPLELWLQRPERMFVIAGDAITRVAGYQYNQQFQQISGNNPKWFPDQIRRDGRYQLIHKILHIKYFNPTDDWYGLSPLAACARSVDQNNSAEEWNNSLLQNGARPSGVVTIKNATDDQLDAVADGWRKRNQGPGKVGGTIFSNGEDMDYTAIGMTPQEMSWIEGMNLSTQRICAALRVPTELIGATQHRTFNNVSEARKAGYMEGALPRYDHIIDELNHWLAPFYGDDIRFGYDSNDIEAIQEDRQFVSDRALNGLKAGALSVGDYRAVVGVDPLPDAANDVVFVPTTVVPTKVEELGQQPATPVPAVPVLAPAGGRPQLVAPRTAA